MQISSVDAAFRAFVAERVAVWRHIITNVLNVKLILNLQYNASNSLLSVGSILFVATRSGTARKWRRHDDTYCPKEYPKYRKTNRRRAITTRGVPKSSPSITANRESFIAAPAVSAFVTSIPVPNRKIYEKIAFREKGSCQLLSLTIGKHILRKTKSFLICIHNQNNQKAPRLNIVRQRCQISIA